MGFFENAHSNIDSLLNMNSLKDKLAELTGLQEKYQFGSEGKGLFSNNIIESLVDSQTKNKDIEDLLKFSLGGSFGQDNQWSSMLQGGKDWGKFNVGRSF